MRVEEFFWIGSTEKVDVGTKCTIHYYSDAHPAEVVKISKFGKTCWIRRNEVKADLSKECGIGHQNWLYKEGDFMKIHSSANIESHLAEQPDNYTYYKVTKRKNGEWRTSRSNLYIQMNCWHNYYDWSF